MPPTKSNASQYELKHYSQFVNKQIARVELAEFEPGFDLIPVFTFTDGTFAQAWCDPEGNGPGWLSLHDSEGHEIVPEGLKTGDFEKSK